jgi:hypothetical protein
MAFTSVSKTDKLLALNAAKADFERELYKNLARLGYDPDTYDTSSFTFDSSASEEVDPDIKLKKQVANSIARLNLVNQKISDI